MDYKTFINLMQGAREDHIFIQIKIGNNYSDIQTLLQVIEDNTEAMWGNQDKPTDYIPDTRWLYIVIAVGLKATISTGNYVFSDSQTYNTNINRILITAPLYQEVKHKREVYLNEKL